MKRVLITAGPTREPIDAVRFIGNRSSGRMGVALAEAAARRGDEVTLLLGPIHVDPPEGVRVERFETAAELRRLLDEHFKRCDVLIMAAAVADYRPVTRHHCKLPRGEGMAIELEPVPDLVAGLSESKRQTQVIVAFALEQPDRLEARAAEKMRRKGVDAIVANPLATMDARGIHPLWLTADGRREDPGELDKSVFAEWLWERIDGL